MTRQKPQIGKLRMNPDASPKHQEEPSWEGIPSAVREAYEERKARTAAIAAAIAADPERQAAIAAEQAAIRNAPPPWKKDCAFPIRPEPSTSDEAARPERKPLKSMAKLKDARRKVQKLGEVVRDEAFEDWLGRYVVNAERPDEWTRSRVLYENYLRRAKYYGQNRQDKALSKQALATETMWGKLMGAQFPNKKRTREGWFYPIRLKQGA